MQYALTEDEIRMQPYKGGRGFCPGCRGVLIAHCGDILEHHWSHESLNDCDSWNHEPITQWHLDWQNQFEEDQREVTIKRNGEHHRADVVTSKETVIEFQHSPIKPDEIVAREQFYGTKMLWVINAGEFVHHLDFFNFRVETSKLVGTYVFYKSGGYLNRGLVVKVPSNDSYDFIKPALEESGFKKSVSYTDREEELWLSDDGSSCDNLHPEVIKAFHKYFLFPQIAKHVNDDKVKFDTMFRWKRFKKSWRFSTNPKFLDLSNGYMLWIKTLHDDGGGVGFIITKNKFLKHYATTP